MQKREARILILTMILILFMHPRITGQEVQWTIKDDIQPPNKGDQQTASQVLDIDNDGVDEFVITERTGSPSVVWYDYDGTTWERNIVDSQPLHIEAGGASMDIDSDGDTDIVFGGDYKSNEIWWWENPYPDYSGEWKRHTIKDFGKNKHHDQLFGDFDHDGQEELVSWNQGDSKLLLFEIPARPGSAEEWDHAVIHEGSSRDEGLYKGDINLDGKTDIVGAGKWFEHIKGKKFKTHRIDPEMNFTRSAVGQLVEGGRPEVFLAPGDANGDAKWYEYKENRWQGHKLDYVTHGHTVDIRDVNNDGNPDIFLGEMGDPGAGDQARIMIWYGNGKGSFKQKTIRTGQGIHEGRLGYLNNDKILDILVKPYHHRAPKVEVMTGNLQNKLPLNQ